MPQHPASAFRAEEAAGKVLRQVVIPVIVLGPCGEQLQVAFDDGYSEQLAAAEAAAPNCEGSSCEGSRAAALASPDACVSAPGSAESSMHGSNASSPPASTFGDVAEQPTGPAAAQAGLAAPAPPQPSRSSSLSATRTSTTAASTAAATPASLVQRLSFPASHSVLSVADVAALYRQEAANEQP